MYVTVLALIATLAASPLIDAVKKGDVSAVRAQLKGGANVNTPEGDGATALHWAVYRDSADLVKLLLDAGASAKTANDLGVTPLHLAAANGNTAIIKLLLDRKADANAAQASGVTPLMEATRAGSVDAVRLLLANGAQVNARESARGQTALMWAVSRLHPEIVKVLIENHADMQARTSERPVMAMLDRGPRAVKTSAHDAREIVNGGSTALMLAAQNGSVESARLLLAAGANANDTAGDGKSALVMAAMAGHSDVALMLLNAGADPNAAGAGYTALHAAALRGDVAVVTALLKKGADANATLTKGSPVRRFGSQWALSSPFTGGTPLIVAAAYLEPAVMRALIEGGANPNASLPDGTTALHLVAGAPIEKETRPSDLVRFNVIDNDTPEVPRVEKDALEAIELLVSSGANVNAMNKDGRTALSFTLPRKPARGPAFPGYPDAEAMLRKLGAIEQ